MLGRLETGLWPRRWEVGEESVLEGVAAQPHSDGTWFPSLLVVVLYVVCSWIYGSDLHK